MSSMGIQRIPLLLDWRSNTHFPMEISPFISILSRDVRGDASSYEAYEHDSTYIQQARYR